MSMSDPEGTKMIYDSQPGKVPVTTNSTRSPSRTSSIMRRVSTRQRPSESSTLHFPNQTVDKAGTEKIDESAKNLIKPSAIPLAPSAGSIPPPEVSPEASEVQRLDLQMAKDTDLCTFADDISIDSGEESFESGEYSEDENEFRDVKAPAKVGQRTLSNVPSDALTEEIKLASEFQNPFPCQVEGCPNFHDDEKTCLCKEHVGAFTIAHAPRISECIKELHYLRHRAPIVLRYSEIILLTIIMAVLETDSKRLLAILSSALATLVLINTYISMGVPGLLCILFLLIYFAFKLWNTTFILEDMDKSWKAFDDAFEVETQKCRDNNEDLNSETFYGPAPLLSSNQRQPGPRDITLRQLYVQCQKEFDVFRSIMFMCEKKGGFIGNDENLIELRRSDGPSLKRLRRAKEKIRLDYDGDVGRIKDLLRGAIYCDDLKDMGDVWIEVQTLEQQGYFVVEQIKNRFHPKSDSVHGYRDLNLILRIGNVLAELQIILTPFADLKKKQHRSYELARSLGLVGPLGTHSSGSPSNRYIKFTSNSASKRTRLALLCLRLVALISTIILGFYFLMSCVKATWEDPVYQVFLTFALNVPYATLFYMLLYDLRIFGAIERKRNRTSLLYDKYFGLNGHYYSEKFLLQCASKVFIQAFAKLPMLSALIYNKAMFWIFLTTLFVQSLYPAYFLRTSWPRNEQQKIFAKRAALCDGFFDFIYTICGSFVLISREISTLLSDREDLDSNISIGVMTYLSYILPVLQIATLARAVEISAMESEISKTLKVAARKRSARNSRRFARRSGNWTPWRIFYSKFFLYIDTDIQGRNLLPVGAFCLYSLLTLSFVFISLFTVCKNGYPHVDTGGCFPCECKYDSSSTFWLRTCRDRSHPVPLSVDVDKAYDLSGLYLKKFYIEKNKKNFYFSSKFIEGVEWEKVMASKIFRDFQKIDFTYNKIASTLPTEMGTRMTNLQQFKIRANSFTGPLPTELGLMTNFRILKLKSNSFSGPLPTQLGSLTLLSRLKVNSNMHSSSIPTELGKLKDMTVMKMANNNLCGEIPTEVVALMNQQGVDYKIHGGNSIESEC